MKDTTDVAAFILVIVLLIGCLICLIDLSEKCDFEPQQVKLYVDSVDEIKINHVLTLLQSLDLEVSQVAKEQLLIREELMRIKHEREKK